MRSDDERTAANESEMITARPFMTASVLESRQTNKATKKSSGTANQRLSCVMSRLFRATNAMASATKVSTHSGTFTPQGVARSSRSPTSPKMAAAPRIPRPSLVLSPMRTHLRTSWTTGGFTVGCSNNETGNL